LPRTHRVLLAAPAPRRGAGDRRIATLKRSCRLLTGITVACASTMQVVNALIKADKDFELHVVPGAGHGAGGSPYDDSFALADRIRSMRCRARRASVVPG
jgi:hypothetical protein